jgi:hypothetical protein
MEGPPRMTAQPIDHLRVLVGGVFGAIAHFERRLIAKRTRDGSPPLGPVASGPGATLSIQRRSPPRWS